MGCEIVLNSDGIDIGNVKGTANTDGDHSPKHKKESNKLKTKFVNLRSVAIVNIFKAPPFVTFVGCYSRIHSLSDDVACEIVCEIICTKLSV